VPPPLLSRALVPIGAFLFRFRDGLFPVFALVTALVSLPPELGSLSGAAAWGLLGGALLALAGQALRLAVIGYAYIQRGGRNRRAYAETLVVRGFFAHSRHPMYVGNLGIVIGLCLAYGSTFSMGVVLPAFVLIYLAMALNEEAFLLGKFPDAYREYMARVPRFWLRLAGLSESLQEFTYDWRRALRKDYGQVTLTIGGVVLIATLRLRALVPAAGTWGLLVGGLVVAFYVVTRFLKKTRRLET